MTTFLRVLKLTKKPSTGAMIVSAVAYSCAKDASRKSAATKPGSPHPRVTVENDAVASKAAAVPGALGLLEKDRASERAPAGLELYQAAPVVAKARAKPRKLEVFQDVPAAAKPNKLEIFVQAREAPLNRGLLPETRPEVRGLPPRAHKIQEDDWSCLRMQAILTVQMPSGACRVLMIAMQVLRCIICKHTMESFQG